MPQFTSRYGIPYPVPGDPVHLGAAQMEALAKSVDNHMGQVSDSSAVDATPNATPNRIIARDAAGRAKIATPSVAADISNKSYVDSGDNAIKNRLGGLTFQTSTTAPPSGTPSTTITFVVEP